MYLLWVMICIKNGRVMDACVFIMGDDLHQGQGGKKGGTHKTGILVHRVHGVGPQGVYTSVFFGVWIVITGDTLYAHCFAPLLQYVSSDCCICTVQYFSLPLKEVFFYGID